MKSLLVVSLTLNFLVLIGLGGFLWHKGGFEYLHAKYVAYFVSSPYSAPDRPFYESTYHRTLSTQFNQLPVDSTSILFAGDSHVERGRWDELLSVPVLNRGIGGEMTTDLLWRADQLTRGKPATILLLTGANDANRGRKADEILATYEEILATLQTESPSTELFVLTIPRFGAGLPNSRAVNDVINEVNRGLSERVSKYQASLIDVATALEGPDGALLNLEYTLDHVHLTAAGYQVVANQIAPHLTSRFRSRTNALSSQP